ncbi:MAG: xylulokinase [Candidatus Aerophobetes bacterium]|nr:xylulokinase [Candidatus Aerophobetes bacterium]
MAYLMGIDVGTTGAKTILISETGKVVCSLLEEYPLYTPRPNRAEQNPEDWWNATVKSIKGVLGKSGIKGEEIKGVGLSGQMHGAVLIDKNYKVLRPCILWCDQRTAKQCEYITRTIGRDRLIQVACNPALTGFTAGKVIWVRDNEPKIYEKIFKILLPKDYIRFMLTGSFATEVSDASGTLFLDVKERRWSNEILEKLDIDRNLLPECYESTVISGEISPNVSHQTGLKTGTPVVGGAGDQASQAVGSGIIKEGRIGSTIGTSGVVFAFSNEVKVDPSGRVHTFCHAVPKKWHIMGVMLSAGGSLRWFRDNLGSQEIREAKAKDVDPYEVLTREASTVEAGCEGLVFLPYLTGERTPYADPDARGVFFGLTLRHKKPHLIRSIMEGVSYGLRDSLKIIKEMRVPVEEVRASGGGARSSLWRQIQADVNGLELVTVNITEGAAFGASLLSGVGAGVYDNIEEACEETIRITSRVLPRKENVKRYNEYYKIYRSLYPILKNSFSKVSKVVKGDKDENKM